MCWPFWLNVGQPDEDHKRNKFSLTKFNKLPDVLPVTLEHPEQVFVKQLKDIYDGKSPLSNPLANCWGDDIMQAPPPTKGGRPAKAKANVDKVKRLAGIFKDYWGSVCGQQKDQVDGDNLLAIVAVMNGLTTRVELREI